MSRVWLSSRFFFSNRQFNYQLLRTNGLPNLHDGWAEACLAGSRGSRRSWWTQMFFFQEATCNRWWFHFFLFSPLLYLGKRSNLTNIFQMG